MLLYNVQGVLSAVRNSAGSICVEELHKTNAPKIMTLAGSKGSEINIAQMVACVGQQVCLHELVPCVGSNRFKWVSYSLSCALGTTVSV